ncbi:beta-ketoacyl-[acyl-carrier-protein] synthase family protein [Hyalangium sp.]|uniref:beta-ketoacyl-[acyl-carrier-protein] synthase family protein n=1 Tax=Hyalangium sp. TaxID=2028555 RepID=UPI002D526821|nr:beta-ketoacyl-[acyl-carrier-protein] synthase family protein [Hyalangium sp.]HYH97112.1 beta-ketoacyl-[acyl-carrier-protein] synthase family protein [Hyalangium sp.]
MGRDAFVRGVGAVSSLGLDWTSTAAALARGESAIARVEHFDVEGFPCQVAAAVRGVAEGAEDRRREFALRAAREAWGRARVGASPERVGIFIGAESGRASFSTVLALAQAAGGGARFDHEAFGQRARELAPRIDAAAVSPAAVASMLAGELGARGPCETLSLACSSGAAAIVEGVRAIRRGEVDVALCGGVGADVDPLMLAGFGLLGALSARGVSCPFDAHRDGFVVGEGAAMVVLAAEKGDAVAAVAGVGRSLDAWHLTAPDPEGAGASMAMRAALREARIEAVDCVQAHGTSTQLNDEVEAQALRRVLGARLAEAHVSSVKGALGHWIAGAGALGFLCAVHALERDEVLPTAGLSHPDPRCELPHVLGKALSKRVGSALVNAFAFGGANTSLVMVRA